jgi:hypothetical protein
MSARVGECRTAPRAQYQGPPRVREDLQGKPLADPVCLAVVALPPQRVGAVRAARERATQVCGPQVAEVGRVSTVGQCDDVVCAVRSAEPAEPADALVSVDDLSHDLLPASAGDAFRPRWDDDLDCALVPDGDAGFSRPLSAHASTLRDGLDGSNEKGIVALAWPSTRDTRSGSWSCSSSTIRSAERTGQSGVCRPHRQEREGAPPRRPCFRRCGCRALDLEPNGGSVERERRGKRDCRGRAGASVYWRGAAVTTTRQHARRRCSSASFSS